MVSLRPPVPRRLAVLLRFAGPLAVTAACLWLLAQNIDMDVLRQLPSELARLPLLHLLAALALCGLSFWAIGRYDGVAHRHFDTGLPEAQARASGTIAIALAQTLGFGVITGAAVRWRMLPGLSAGQALRLSTFVAVTFLLGWAGLSALAVLLLPAPGWTALPALATLLALGGLLYLAAVLPHRQRRPLRGLPFALPRIPPLQALAAIGLWAAVDLLAAALLMYLVLPGAGPGFAAFLPAFLLAFGAGLLSGSPGGVGPFELVLIALLPQMPLAELLAGILAFRAVYYLIPALIAGGCLLRPFAPPPKAPYRAPTPLARARRAEVGVIRQNNGTLCAGPASTLALWQTPQTLTALFDPLSGAPQAALQQITTAAKAGNRLPCLYKCSGRLAQAARADGWAVLRIAQDAWLDPAALDLSTRSRRGLRRKQRNADKAGVRCHSPSQLPLAQMAALDADWQARQGRALGGTMGRFCPDYLAQQLVLLAYCGDALVAYVSFHRSDHELCLDVMRSGCDAPDGTMHALIIAATKAAAAAGIDRVNLAAVPSITAQNPLWQRLAGLDSRAGLRQFKSSFAPHWQPLYAAAPNRLALAIALADIAAAVHRPQALPDLPRAHEEDEDIDIALPCVS